MKYPVSNMQDLHPQAIWPKRRQHSPSKYHYPDSQGWEYACRIVRNHRLWELYLTNEAKYAPDHVHEDAEKIEHVIGEKTVRKLERLLKNPKRILTESYSKHYGCASGESTA